MRQLRGGAAAGLCIRVGVAAGAVDVAAHDGGAVPHPEGLSRPQPHPRRPLRHEFGARLPALHECLRKRATEIQGPQLRVRPELERKGRTEAYMQMQWAQRLRFAQHAITRLEFRSIRTTYLPNNVICITLSAAPPFRRASLQAVAQHPAWRRQSGAQ